MGRWDRTQGGIKSIRERWREKKEKNKEVVDLGRIGQEMIEMSSEEDEDDSIWEDSE